MQVIEKDNKIFSSVDYLKDKSMFHLITKNLKSPDVMLISDEENYVICRGSTDWPTWIWTKDNFDISKLDEIKTAMELYLTAKEKDDFTCKKELYDLLVSTSYDKLNLDDYFEMGTLCCRKTKKPRECDGYMDKPNIDDKDVLVQYWFNDCNEMNGVESITMDKAVEDVDNMISSDSFFVWRNNDNKIVCMANYNEIDKEARVNHVYTPVEERKKGYAANLIYSMTNNLLERGVLPLLYTDYNYPASNRAYINAGYEATGILINFSCSKEKKMNLKK